MDYIKIKYYVCAVIFGADECLLGIKLKDEFSFVKKSLIPSVDHMNEIFEIDAMGLRREYELARLDEESLDVLCVEKTIIKDINSNDVEKFFDEQSDNDLHSLDDQLRLIRLYNECPVRCKYIAYKLKTDSWYNEVTKCSNSIVSFFPISESRTTNEISRFSYDKETIEKTNDFLAKNTLPFEENDLLFAHRFYDLSYHTELFVSIALLATAVEVLFLDNDKGCKKEMLSKRCAAYVSADENEIKLFYDKLKSVYALRSDFVHDGKISDIQTDDVIFLRDCVRKTIIKALDNRINKKDRIIQLKKYVKSHPYIYMD